MKALEPIASWSLRSSEPGVESPTLMGGRSINKKIVRGLKKLENSMVFGGVEHVWGVIRMLG